MSSKALYSKYRPRKLAEVIGQEHIKTSIENSIKRGRLSHAYLFTGMRGTGKTTVARILSMIFNCEDGPNSEYDISQGICKTIIKNQCPDIKELDAASNTSIEEIAITGLHEAVSYCSRPQRRLKLKEQRCRRIGTTCASRTPADQMRQHYDGPQKTSTDPQEKTGDNGD